MARLVERVLIWLAALVTVAAVAAVILTFFPSRFAPLPWQHPGDDTTIDQRPAIDLAEQAIALGEEHSALRLAKRAALEDGSNAAVDNRAGNVALRAGSMSAAEHYYLAGERADRRYPWNFVALGQLYARQGKRQLAEAQLLAATAAAPDIPFIHYDLGAVELEDHRYGAALADFNVELKMSPAYKPAMIGRARALENIERRSVASVSHQRAAAHPVAATSRSHLPRTLGAPKRRISLARRSSRTALVTQSHRISRATVAPQPTEDHTIDARRYVISIVQDVRFTRALPAADPRQSTAELQRKLEGALASMPLDIETALQVGTAALLSGRPALASTAFGALSKAAPRDWRGPYLDGLTAQADGDSQLARTLFGIAISRRPRSEAYTSLAVADLESGDTAAAALNSDKAVSIDPAYEPGRFLAGMVDLLQGDVREAKSNLSAAVTLGGAPSRTNDFLNALDERVGQAGAPSE